MKTLVLAIFLILTAAAVPTFSQNTIKLFDQTVISSTDTSQQWTAGRPFVFATKDVYLSCPMGGQPLAYITGPDNGNLAADNFFMMNGQNICPDEWNCFAGVFAIPMQALGMPMSSAYNSIAPIDVSSRISGSGLYHFELSDYGYTYGNSDIYLHTSCSMGNYVCHRNYGKADFKTLEVTPNSMAAHLAHGDVAGPCQ
jgi:hypothetical protein